MRDIPVDLILDLLTGLDATGTACEGNQNLLEMLLDRFEAPATAPPGARLAYTNEHSNLDRRHARH